MLWPVLGTHKCVIVIILLGLTILVHVPELWKIWITLSLYEPQSIFNQQSDYRMTDITKSEQDVKGNCWNRWIRITGEGGKIFSRGREVWSSKRGRGKFCQYPFAQLFPWRVKGALLISEEDQRNLLYGSVVLHQASAGCRRS